MTPWYVDSFGVEYLKLYAHRDQGEAESDVQSICRLITPDRAAPVLDLGCGAGRHLVALHKAGFTALTGLDLSRPLLDEARSALLELGAAEVRLVRGDMRRVPFRDEFALVLSLFTSFGYFDRDAQNERVLRSASRALRPDGVLLMDVLNGPFLVSSLVPHEERVVDDKRLCISRSYDARRHRVEKTTRVDTPDGRRRTYRESVRLYDAQQLTALLERAGFARTSCYGSLNGAPYTVDSPRLVVVSQRGGSPPPHVLRGGAS